MIGRKKMHGKTGKAYKAYYLYAFYLWKELIRKTNNTNITPTPTPTPRDPQVFCGMNQNDHSNPPKRYFGWEVKGEKSSFQTKWRLESNPISIIHQFMFANGAILCWLGFQERLMGTKPPRLKSGSSSLIVSKASTTQLTVALTFQSPSKILVLPDICYF